jgi:hypothetical protein
MTVQANPPTSPGTYPGGGLAPLLRANERQWLLRQQLIAGGGSFLSVVSTRADGSNPYASIAVQLERIKSAFYPFGASLQIFFTNSSGAAANPGAFEIDWQTSDIDLDTQYNTISSLTGGLSASYSGRIELPTFWASYSRVYVATLTNPVYVNALLTR